MALELDDIAGTRGYPRCRASTEEERSKEPGVAYGEVEEERRMAEVWRRGRFAWQEGGVVPWIWPVRRAINAARRAGRFKAAMALRACVEGAWIQPRKVWARGGLASDRCECGKEAGTLFHTVATCEVSEDLRLAKCKPAIMREAVAQVWDPLYSRGVPAKPKDPPTVPKHIWWEEKEEGVGRIAQGEVYVDGSFKGLHWRAARSAWAAVSLGKEGCWIWTMSGTVEEEHSTSYRAELKAVLEVLRIAVPPLTIFCDNLEVVKGRRRGREWCTAAKTDCADVWRDIWFYLDDLGEGVAIAWVKGHTSWFDVLMRRVTPQQHKGNAMADEAAKVARQRAERLAPATAFNGCIHRAVTWLKWLLDYATDWPHKGRGGGRWWWRRRRST